MSRNSSSLPVGSGTPRTSGRRSRGPTISTSFVFEDSEANHPSSPPPKKTKRISRTEPPAEPLRVREVPQESTSGPSPPRVPKAVVIDSLRTQAPPLSPLYIDKGLKVLLLSQSGFLAALALFWEFKELFESFFEGNQGWIIAGAVIWVFSLMALSMGGSKIGSFNAVLFLLLFFGWIIVELSLLGTYGVVEVLTVEGLRAPCVWQLFMILLSFHSSVMVTSLGLVIAPKGFRVSLAAGFGILSAIGFLYVSRISENSDMGPWPGLVGFFSTIYVVLDIHAMEKWRKPKDTENSFTVFVNLCLDFVYKLPRDLLRW